MSTVVEITVIVVSVVTGVAVVPGFNVTTRGTTAAERVRIPTKTA